MNRWTSSIDGYVLLWNDHPINEAEIRMSPKGPGRRTPEVSRRQKTTDWLYYAGLARDHKGEWSAKITGCKGGIGLATIRRDGFISLHAGERAATVVSKPIRFRGARLTVNILAAASGNLRVEIQDRTGRPYPGFSLAECQPVAGDDLEGEVKWLHGNDVSRLAGEPICLKLQMSRADLYSFQFQLKRS